MAKLSSQDVRDKIISLRDELILNLEFIQSAIRQDREKLMAYFEQHGDLRYRPVITKDVDGLPTKYGDPTEIFIEPLATQARTTVKSLLDSIRVIESEILPEDDPEGRQAGQGSGEAGLRSRAALRESFLKDTGGTHLPAPIDDGPVIRTPKEKIEERQALMAKVAATVTVEDLEVGSGAKEKSPAVVSASPEAPAPRPWRETKAGAAESKPAPTMDKSDLEPDERKWPRRNEAEKSDDTPAPKPAKKPPGAIGLSPALRAQIGAGMAGGSSRMDAIRGKYKKDEE